MSYEPYEKREGFEHAFVSDDRVEQYAADGWAVAGSCHMGIIMERRQPNVLKAASAAEEPKGES